MASYSIEKPYNLYKIFWLIEKRPQMYIGSKRLNDLSFFISTYTFCTRMHDIEAEKIFPPFDYFTSWTKMIYNQSRITKGLGWSNILLDANKDSQEEAIKDFFQKLEMFKKLYPISIRKAILRKENITHNESKGSRYGIGELVYKKPQEIYLVEYSQNFGFAYFVIDNDGKSKNWLDVYESEKEVLEILEKQFGEIDNWEILEGDLMNVVEYLMKIR